MTDKLREELLLILGLPRVLRSFQETQTLERLEATIAQREARARAEALEEAAKEIEAIELSAPHKSLTPEEVLAVRVHFLEFKRAGVYVIRALIAK